MIMKRIAAGMLGMATLGGHPLGAEAYRIPAEEVHVRNVADTGCVVREDTDSVYGMVDVLPAYPGGEDALLRTVWSRMVYPPECMRDSVEGRVMVSFVVEMDGRVSHVQAIRSPHPALSAAAENALRGLHGFTPGRIAGKEVRTKMVLPVMFRLGGSPQRDEQRGTGTVWEEPDERMPEFPGGNQAMAEWVGRHLKYPKKAPARCMDGKVYVSFVVETDGTITEVKTLKSPHPDMTVEAEKVIRKMPKWKPSTRNGVPVRMKWVLPILFKRF